MKRTTVGLHRGGIGVGTVTDRGEEAAERPAITVVADVIEPSPSREEPDEVVALRVRPMRGRLCRRERPIQVLERDDAAEPRHAGQGLDALGIPLRRVLVREPLVEPVRRARPDRGAERDVRELVPQRGSGIFPVGPAMHRDRDHAEIGVRDADRPGRGTAALRRDPREVRRVAHEPNLDMKGHRQAVEVGGDSRERGLGTPRELSGGALEPRFGEHGHAPGMRRDHEARRRVGRTGVQPHDQEHEREGESAARARQERGGRHGTWTSTR